MKVRGGVGRTSEPDSSKQWVARVVTTEEVVDVAPVRALSALFDDGLAVPLHGDPLPPLWHWAGLSRWTSSKELAGDGHSVRGTFLPPIDLPRRMFAGGEVEFHAPLTVGGTVRRESVVDSVIEKTGSTGKLVVVTVLTNLYSQNDVLAITERQNLIYRGAGQPSITRTASTAAASVEPSGRPLKRIDDWIWEFATDPTLLMRFSAATSNAHRIHYDWPYATLVEGYPGLVVHGPLVTLALAETLRLQGLSDRVRMLRHRNSKPLFCAESARLCRIDNDSDLIHLGLFGHGEPDPRASLEVEFSTTAVEGNRSA